MKKSATLFMGILLGTLLSLPLLDARSPILSDDDPPALEQAIKKVKAYPNPSDGRFKLSFDSAGDERISAKVFDITGKLVKDITDELVSGEKSVSADVDLENPGAGIYFIRFEWDARVLTTKIIVR